MGYACINNTLQKQKPKVTCNRGMIKRTFKAKGTDYASQLAQLNTADISHEQMGAQILKPSPTLPDHL